MSHIDYFRIIRPPPRREYDLSCRHGVKPPTLTHSDLPPLTPNVQFLLVFEFRYVYSGPPPHLHTTTLISSHPSYATTILDNQLLYKSLRLTAGGLRPPLVTLTTGRTASLSALVDAPAVRFYYTTLLLYEKNVIKNCLFSEF